MLHTDVIQQQTMVQTLQRATNKIIRGIFSLRYKDGVNSTSHQHQILTINPPMDKEIACFMYKYIQPWWITFGLSKNIEESQIAQVERKYDATRNFCRSFAELMRQNNQENIRAIVMQQIFFIRQVKSFVAFRKLLVNFLYLR